MECVNYSRSILITLETKPIKHVPSPFSTSGFQVKDRHVNKPINSLPLLKKEEVVDSKLINSYYETVIYIRKTNNWKTCTHTEILTHAHTHTPCHCQGSQLSLLRKTMRFYLFIFIPESVGYRFYTKLKWMTDYLLHNKASS